MHGNGSVNGIAVFWMAKGQHTHIIPGRGVVILVHVTFQNQVCGVSSIFSPKRQGERECHLPH